MEDEKQIKRKLLETIGTKITDLGFRLNLGRQGFYKKTSFGKYSFHVSFIPHESDLDVTADVAIRFDEIEDLFHDNMRTPFMREDGEKKTFSFGSNLGHISGKGQIRWTIANQGDVKEVAAKMVENFRAVGLPYLERYSDLERVFKAISTVNTEAELLGGFPEYRATKAICIAYLLGKEDEFHSIVEEMTNYLRPIPNSNLEMFLEFARKLEHMFKKRKSSV